jgi:1-acyl-sn-glycerol-3-phosphate acyltransferase
MKPDAAACRFRQGSVSDLVARILLALRTAVAIVWVFVALVFLIPVAGLALLVDRRGLLHDRFAVFWARGILLIMGMRVRCLGLGHVVRGERYVVTANHQGLLDIPSLIVTLQGLTPLRFVAKRSLFCVPVLGWGMWLFGHVPIDRRGATQALPGLLLAEQAVRYRWSVVFFPEGTRTYTGGMGVFKKGAFHTAARAHVRILPVTIIGSWEKLPRQRLFAVARGTIRVHVHPPRDVAGEQIQAAADECRRQIEAGLPDSGADNPVCRRS